MFGQVNYSREAVLKLVIVGDNNRRIAIDAVIYTGFNGDLILPLETISALELKLQGYQKAILGDGMTQKASNYLTRGVLQVWVVDPVEKSVVVFYPDRAPVTYMGDGVIIDNLFPELSIALDQIF